MKRHKTRAALLACTCVLAASLMSCSDNTTAGKPNIVLIVADDLGYGDVNPYWPQTNAQTPVLDNFASQAVRFTDFNISPLCAPSRAAVLTGIPSMENGMWRGPSEGKSEVDDPGFRGVDSDIAMLPQMLKDNGYTTGLVGKWHLGYTSPNIPNDRGFDEFVGFLNGSSPYDYAGAKKHMMHNKQPYDKEFKDTTDLFTDEARRFIQENKDRPFFLDLSYNAVHGPLWSEDRPKFSAQPEWLAKYDGMGLDNARKDYVATISHMDDSIGKVLDTLKEYGLEKNTLVIFLSDNGACLMTGETEGMYPGNNGPFRGGKGNTYNGGFVTALMMRYPDVIPAGGVSDSTVMGTDLLPTILEAAKLPVPKENGGIALKGSSLMQVAKSGGKTKLPDRPYFIELTGNVGLHEGDWKLVGGLPSPRGDYSKLVTQLESYRFELYNLKDDIGETHDVSAQFPDIANKLKAETVMYFKSVADLRDRKQAVIAALPKPENSSDNNTNMSREDRKKQRDERQAERAQKGK
jgi:arylsulfatase A-like enzyme